MRLKKSLLVFATGLFCPSMRGCSSMKMGPQFSATAPFVFAVAARRQLIYVLQSGFDCRHPQLSLFLFAPFVVQWSIGNPSRPTTVCGLAGKPIGAVLFAGRAGSIAWFIAYIFLTALSAFDYYLAGAPVI